jgi:hypothetical protein
LKSIQGKEYYTCVWREVPRQGFSNVGHKAGKGVRTDSRMQARLCREIFNLCDVEEQQLTQINDAESIRRHQCMEMPLPSRLILVLFIPP